MSNPSSVRAFDGKVYALPAKANWRKITKPPEVGWWPASMAGNLCMLRFWDGANFSLPLGPDASPNDAALQANRPMPIEHQKHVRWTDRWWLSEENKGARA